MSRFFRNALNFFLFPAAEILLRQVYFKGWNDRYYSTQRTINRIADYSRLWKVYPELAKDPKMKDLVLQILDDIEFEISEEFSPLDEFILGESNKIHERVVESEDSGFIRGVEAMASQCEDVFPFALEDIERNKQHVIDQCRESASFR